MLANGLGFTFELQPKSMKVQANPACLACSKVLHGRIDKKYCNDYCRNVFNNQRRAESSNYTRRVIRALQQNRRILCHLFMQSESGMVTREQLLDEGFLFRYHTYIQRKSDKVIWRYCFDYGYCAITEDEIKIGLLSLSL